MTISDLPAEILIQIISYVLESDLAGAPVRELVKGQPLVTDPPLYRHIPPVTLVNREIRAAAIAALKSTYLTGNGRNDCTLDSVLVAEQSFNHDWAAIPPRMLLPPAERTVATPIGTRDSMYSIDTLTWVVRPWERISWEHRTSSLFYHDRHSWRFYFMNALRSLLCHGPSFAKRVGHDYSASQWSIKYLELHFRTPPALDRADIRWLPHMWWSGLEDGKAAECDESGGPKILAPHWLAHEIKEELFKLYRPKYLTDSEANVLFEHIGTLSIWIGDRMISEMDFASVLRRSAEETFPDKRDLPPTRARFRRTYHEWQPRVAFRRMALGLEEPFLSMRSEIDLARHSDCRWGFREIKSHIPAEDLDAIRDWKMSDHSFGVKDCTLITMRGGISPCSRDLSEGVKQAQVRLDIAVYCCLAAVLVTIWSC